MDDIINKARGEMDKVIETLNKRFSTVRAGRANPSSLDGVMVEYYGNPQVRVLRKSENVRTKDIAGLNNLHHAVRNAISLIKETAPKCKDCVTEVPVV